MHPFDQQRNGIEYLILFCVDMTVVNSVAAAAC